jgi:hypothetical protein
MKSIYVLTVGGSPLREEFDTLEEALCVADALAIEIADEEGQDFDRYGDDEGGPWGVCPEGDDGAYWPTVTLIGAPS